MSNHIHLLAQSSMSDLSGTIRDFRNYTSKQFIGKISLGEESGSDWMKAVFEYHGKFKNKHTYQIRTHENYAEITHSQKFVEQKLEYFHNNSVRVGIVQKQKDHLYSSARSYAGLGSIFDIVAVDIKWNTVH